MMSTKKILIVEDEISLQETLKYNLLKQGYEVEVSGDGAKAVELAIKNHPDLIILDLMLPGMDGLDVCKTIRQTQSTPIMMVTAKDEEIDRVVGLEIGADDYITKPFSMRELVARVKALLRRVRLTEEDVKQSMGDNGQKSIVVYDNLSIDPIRREILIDNQPCAFKPKEYELLVFLAEHQRQVLTREHILERVWGWDYVGDSRTVDVHIRWLRGKIEKDPSDPKRIITVRGAGYRFEG
jgi:DNA-binding response OmpR family regulator